MHKQTQNQVQYLNSIITFSLLHFSQPIKNKKYNHSLSNGKIELFSIECMNHTDTLPFTELIFTRMHETQPNTFFYILLFRKFSIKKFCFYRYRQSYFCPFTNETILFVSFLMHFFRIDFSFYHIFQYFIVTYSVLLKINENDIIFTETI